MVIKAIRVLLKNTMELTYIYTLTDPITGLVRYVGKSNNPKNRFWAHISAGKRTTITHKAAWINSLIKQGLRPICEIIDAIPKSEWEFWERHYISLFKSWGFNLTNVCDGGVAFNSKILSIVHKGKKISDAVKNILREKNLGKKASEATRKKMRESSPHYWKNKKRPETGPKISEALTGRKMSEDRRLNHQKRMRENHPMKGRKLTEEHKKLLWANRPRFDSEQAKLNKSIATKIWWQQRKKERAPSIV